MAGRAALRRRAGHAEAGDPPRPPLLLAVMSAVLPGSGHLYAGRRRTGLVLLVLFIAFVTAAGAALVWSRDALLRSAVRPAHLTVVVVAAGVGTLVMIVVVLSAYRLGRPRRLSWGPRALSHGLVGLLCLALVGPPALVARYALLQHQLISDVFPTGDDPPGAADPWAGQGRLNVLLVGGDGDESREGIRADSITVASIDTSSGDTIMFSLPRNLQHARFLEGTPADEALPDGYPDFVYGVHRFGAEHPELFPGADDPGIAAVSSVAGQSLGLPIHYYALANMEGFSRMVDAIGGVRIRVLEPLPIGGISASGGPAPVKGYVEPGLRTLDGYEALWYARSRASSDDYDRMERQRCLLGALARQSDPVTLLRDFGDLASATKDTVSTNIPQKRLPDFVDLAKKVGDAEISSVQFVPPEFSSVDPDFDAMRERVRAELDPEPRSTGPIVADSTRLGGVSASPPAASPRDTPGPDPSGSSSSVDDVCSYD